MMMNRFSVAKIAIIVFLVPFCIYLFFLIFSHTKKHLPDDALKGNGDAIAVAQIDRFEMKGLEKEHESFSLNAEKFTQVDEGIFKLDTIHSLVLHTRNKEKISISASRGSMLEEHDGGRTIVAEGSVLLSLEDGTEIRSEKISFDQKNMIVRSDGEVTIEKDGRKAASSSMTYDLEKREVVLSPLFRLVIPRANGDVIVQSQTFIGDLNLREGKMIGGVAIKDDSTEIRAAEALIVSDERGERIETGTFEGGVSGSFVVKGKETGNDTFGTMHSLRMEVTFSGESSMRVVLIDEVTLEIQDSTDLPSERATISCERLEMERSNDGSLRCDMKENAELYRVQKGEEQDIEEYLSCHSLSIGISNGKTIDQADALGKVRYRTGELRAESEEVSFNALNRGILLHERGSMKPVMIMNDWTLSAKQIEIKNDAELVASEQVKSAYRGTSIGKDSIPLFDKDKTLFIASDFLSVKDRNDFQYKGNVRAWQEDNSISAEELRIDSAKQTVHAHNGVVSRFMSISRLADANDTQNRQERVGRNAEMESDDFWYVAQENKALYRGNAILKMERREIKSDEMEILFSEDEKAEEIKAKNNVSLMSPEFRATGHEMTYTLDDEHTVINGNAEPVRIYDDRGSEVIIAPSLTFHMSDDKMGLNSPDGGRTWIILE